MRGDLGRQRDGEWRKSKKTRGQQFAENVAAGMDQKSAALRAGYSLSVAEHPKRKLWNQKNIVAAFQKLAQRTLPPTRAEKLLDTLLDGRSVVMKVRREKLVDADGRPILDQDGKVQVQVSSIERTETVDRGIQLRTLELIVAHGGLLPPSASRVIGSESLDEVLARAERERVQHETQLAPS